MKTIAIVDVETSGLDPKVDALLEVACVRWSVEHRAVVDARSWLVSGARENAAQAVNGIPVSLAAAGDPRTVVERDVELFTVDCDVVTGWNYEDFDRYWLGAEMLQRPFFEAMDLEWPRSSESRSLVATALAHGVGVVDAHRALTDCLTVARLFERVAEMKLAEPDDHTDDRNVRSAFDVWLARALRPKVHVEVADKGFDEARNTLVKAHGFRWEPAPVKAWRRKMFAEDAEKLPFRVVEVTP